jgi:hypothetical protein
LAPPPSDSADAPRYARPFVAVFLGTMVVCAVASVNAWPFSSWRLFSSLRTDRQLSWQAVAVDARGDERAYPIGPMAHGYRGFRPVMVGFARRTPSSRDAICRAWLRGATKRFGPDTTAVRIYDLTWRVSHRRGERAGPAVRTMAWTCTPEGANAGA